MKGRFFLEKKVFEKSNVDIRSFPFRKKIVDFVKSQNEFGRKTILISNNYLGIAEKMFNYLGIFSSILASENHKISFSEIKNILIKKFKNNDDIKQFDYIGNAAEDLQIFEISRFTYLVEPSISVELQARKTANVEAIFRGKKDKIQIFFQAIHFERLIKNLLIFLSSLLLTNWFNFFVNFPSLILGFISLSLISSASYLLNDLFDLNFDRKNTLKFHRPVATGLFQLQNSFVLIHFFVFWGFAISLIFLPPIFNITLMFFLFFEIIYSTTFKNIPIFNIIILALLLAFRVFSGFFVAEIELKLDYIFCILPFSFSLIFYQKYCENILILKKQNEKNENNVVDKLKKQNKLFLNLCTSFFAFAGVLIYFFAKDFTKSIIFFNSLNSLTTWLIFPIFISFFGWILAKAKKGKIQNELIISFIKSPISYIFLTFFVIFVIILKQF